MKETYRIGELAEKGGVTKRTIHYYVGRGLLPPPEGAGVGTTYTEEHLVKLKLIKQLQERHYPLNQIRNVIMNMTLNEAKQQLAEPGTLPEIADTLSEEVDNCADNSDVKMSVLRATAPSNEQTAALTDMSRLIDISGLTDISRSYVRCNIGLGIELHIPAELARDNPVLIENIDRYVRKLISEK